MKPTRVSSRALLGAVTACACLVAAIGACAQEVRPSFDGDDAGSDGGGFSSNGSSGTPPPQAGEVYGHSDGSLYRVDTRTREITEISTFQGCAHVADIALDQRSTIYASTGAELYLIEAASGRCSRVAQGKFPNSLSFVPAGVLDATEEVLVGFEGGDYVRVDVASGKVTKVGQLGGGFQSSGDMVTAKDGKGYVTVKGPGCADCLVQVDPKTGALVKNLGPLGHTDVFGVAFWGGELYGFTNDGSVLLIELTGDVAKVTELPFAGKPAGLQFRGAGSTTSAPLGPVR
ncbi:MAG: hypothetical protein KC657_35745 [Myxococcales bacterium]|nr:hypothetical protein [Myxococcales bacterium]